MSVPPEDILCRFIRPKLWSEKEQRPKFAAFKQENMSVWNKNKLLENDVQLEELKIGSLAKAGQAHFTAQDFIDLSVRVSQQKKYPFEVRVKWRPECTVDIFKEWDYAHVQVEAIKGSSMFPSEFREELSKNCRHKIPPDPP